MRWSSQRTFFALSLWLALALGCHETAEETVMPVDLAPSDPPDAPAAPEVEALTVRVLQKYPHDQDAFTQGLLWHDGALYESTGRYGASSVRRVRLEDTGGILPDAEDEIPREVTRQALRATESADLLVLVAQTLEGLGHGAVDDLQEAATDE